MAILYFIILVCALWGIRLRSPADSEAALTANQTTMIKGIFVLLVFASHIGQYLALDVSDGILTHIYLFIRSKLGQLIVVPFLFYSGYGIRCSLEKKGAMYLRSFPKKRILKTYLHTALILVLFWITQLVLGNSYSVGKCISAFLLWDSFGNSNWYIFVILLLYFVTWLSFRWTKRHPGVSILLCTGFVLIFFLVLYRLKESWWYNTMLVYCFGLSYPDLKRTLHRLWDDHAAAWWSFLFGTAAAALVLTLVHLSPFWDGFRENIRAILLMLFLNCFLTKVRLGNRLLHWLGSHVFECYLLQRIPMIVFSRLGLPQHSVLLFVLLCAAITLLLAILFRRIFAALDKKLFPA